MCLCACVLKKISIVIHVVCYLNSLVVYMYPSYFFYSQKKHINNNNNNKTKNYVCDGALALL